MGVIGKFVNLPAFPCIFTSVVSTEYAITGHHQGNCYLHFMLMDYSLYGCQMKSYYEGMIVKKVTKVTMKIVIKKQRKQF